ncbi:MAG TPA: NAD-dependent epimerase/dehydratase family protein [Clostridia bacterium]|nr:NAD-dependent epimerase/dehydratase family protein [Clostridia bacterium]
MKTLFIGGTGNISSACAAALQAMGQEVYILTRGRHSVPAGYHALVADRNDPAAMQAAFQSARPDVVVDFIAYDVPDVQAAFNLCRGRVAQYIFISSATVYARPAARLPLVEDAPLGNPVWEYAQKKVACETWLRQRHAETQFPVTIVRPSHTYSQRWVPNVVSSSSYTVAARLEAGKPVFVPDNGQNPWTLTAASDFAIGFAGLAGNPAAIGEAFHITGDEVLTWNQIYAEIAAAVGAKNPDIRQIPTDIICQAAPHLVGTLKGDKTHPGLYDNSKLKRLVPAFRTRKPFHLGVRESVAWLRSHPDQQNLKPEIDQAINRICACAALGC